MDIYSSPVRNITEYSTYLSIYLSIQPSPFLIRKLGYNYINNLFTDCFIQILGGSSCLQRKHGKPGSQRQYDFFCFFPRVYDLCSSLNILAIVRWYLKKKKKDYSVKELLKKKKTLVKFFFS